MMNTAFPAASTGWVDPRSWSLALSSAQTVGAKKLLRTRPGVSRVTESLPSYGWPEPAAPFPTETHRSPSGPVTGPAVPQTAPSLLVGVCQLTSGPPPDSGTPTTEPMYWPQSPASPPNAT